MKSFIDSECEDYLKGDSCWECTKARIDIGVPVGYAGCMAPFSRSYGMACKPFVGGD